MDYDEWVKKQADPMIKNEKPSSPELAEFVDRFKH